MGDLMVTAVPASALDTDVLRTTRRAHPLIIILPFVALFIAILLTIVKTSPNLETWLVSIIGFQDLINIIDLVFIIFILIIVFVPTGSPRSVACDEPLPNPMPTKTTDRAEPKPKLEPPETSTSSSPIAKSRLVETEIVAAPAEVRSPQRPVLEGPKTIFWPRDVSDGVYGDTLIQVGPTLTLQLRTLLIDYQTLRRL